MYQRSNWRKYGIAILVIELLSLALPAGILSAFPLEIQYAGRLTRTGGMPEVGPVELSVGFFRSATGDDSVAVSLAAFTNVALVDGVFQISIELSPADLDTLLGGATAPFIQVVDVTHSKTYPRQRFAAIPYALRVPVDETTITYDAQGRLSAPQAGSITTYDANSDGTVDNAAQLGGQAASFYTNAANMTTGSLADGRLSSNVTKLGQTIGTGEIEDGAITVQKLAGGMIPLTATGGSSFTLETTPAGHALHQWAAKTAGDHAVSVKDGTQVTITKLAAGTGYGSWVYWPESVARNFDVSFRVSGLEPLTTERNFAIAIASDGTNTAANFDRLVIRIVPDTPASNRIALEVAGGAAEQVLTSAAIPDLFDLGDHQVLLQVRDRTYAVEIDGVAVHSFTGSARTRATGVVGIAIYEGFDASTIVTLRQWKVIGRPTGVQLENTMRIVPSSTSSAYGALSLGTGAFDGATAGYFGTGGSSNGSGTLLAGNAGAGYAGDLANLEVAGASKFKIDASGNVVMSGSISGTNSLAAPGAIGGATANAGAFTTLSSTGYSQGSGNFSISGTGTFATGTGSVSLNGDTTIAAGKNLSLAAGTGTLTQTYSGTTGTAATFAADSLTSGSIMSLTSSSTAAAAGNTGLNIAISGANATSGMTRYGLRSAVTATGTNSTNVAGYFSAAGGANNYGLIIENGNVGIGATAPREELTVASNSEARLALDSAGASAIVPSRIDARFARGTIASPTVVGNSDELLTIGGTIYNGSAYATYPSAMIRFLSDGVAGVGDHPGQIGFLTIPDGGSTLVERMLIKNSGNVGIGTVQPLAILDIYGNSGTTTTTSSINAQGTAGTANITVASTTGFPSEGVMVIDSEAITYTVVNSTTINIGSRAQLGTTGVTHADGATVRYIEEILSKGATSTPHRVTMSDGSVGIGTTSPSNILHVVGSLCVKSVAGNCSGTTAGTIYATATTITGLAQHHRWHLWTFTGTPARPPPRPRSMPREQQAPVILQ